MTVISELVGKPLSTPTNGADPIMTRLDQILARLQGVEDLQQDIMDKLVELEIIDDGSRWKVS